MLTMTHDLLNNVLPERRPSISSSDTMTPQPSAAGDMIEETPSPFFPPSKRAPFYTRVWKEYKKRRNERRMLHLQQSVSGGGGGNDGGGEGSAVDPEIPRFLDLTRRKRNSFSSKLVGVSSRSLQPTNFTAYLAARVESEKPLVKEARRDHAAVLLGGWSHKDHMMDVSLLGGDGVPVGASKFILGCYSPVLEEVFFKGRESPDYHYDPASSQLTIDFADEKVLRAAVHHCFGGSLPADFPITRPSEAVARSLARLDHLAHVFKLAALGEVTYRALRKLINGRLVLACAIFDELSHCEGAGAVDSIKRYALDTMREMPMDTLLGGGVQWMKEESVEAIIQDQDMDVDEFFMFKILMAWASAKDTGEDRLPVARRLSKHIELKFIDPELLMTQVMASGYFSEKELTEAVGLIEDSLANRDQCEMERVLVEGAGMEIVNGIYFRVEQEAGMSEEEILFVKEADDGYSDVGLYLWGSHWYIAMCADYSNCFYSCEEPPNKPLNELVPRTGWVITSADDPPPTCTYLPNMRMGRLKGFGRLAPNLEEMLDPTIAEKRRSEYFDRRLDDAMEKRMMTLEQMMNLPEDLREDRDQPEDQDEDLSHNKNETQALPASPREGPIPPKLSAKQEFGDPVFDPVQTTEQERFCNLMLPNEFQGLRDVQGIVASILPLRRQPTKEAKAGVFFFIVYSLRLALSHRMPVTLLLPLTLVVSLISLFFLFVKPLTQHRPHHNFADMRHFMWSGHVSTSGFISPNGPKRLGRAGFIIPNFCDVVSNAAIFAGGIFGLAVLYSNGGAAAESESIRKWQVQVCLPIFFSSTVAISVGSTYYHWNPNDSSLLWDRLPMTLTSVSLFCYMLEEYLPTSGIGQSLLPSLLTLGILSVLNWRFTNDMRLNALLQLFSLLVIAVLIIFCYPPRHGGMMQQVLALMCYAGAKVCEERDAAIFDWTNKHLSGHSLKHVVIGVAAISIASILKTNEYLDPSVMRSDIN